MKNPLGALLLLMCISLCFFTLVRSDAVPPELQAAVLTTSDKYFDPAGTFFTSDNDSVIFGFSSQIAISVASGDRFQVRLPPHYTTKNIAIIQSSFICQLELESQLVAIGSPKQLAIVGETGVELSCTFSSSVNIIKGGKHRLRFKGVGCGEAVVHPDCASSLFPPSPGDFLDVLLFPFTTAFPFTKKNSIERSGNGECCRSANLSLFLSSKCVDTAIIASNCAVYLRETPDYASTNGLTCTGHCNAADTRFVDLEVSASSNVALTVTPLSISFTTAVQLDVSLQTKQATTDEVPAYLWYKLPNHSCSYSNPSDINSHSVQCVLKINGVTDVTGIPSPSSPNTVVRYINSQYTQQGIYVACSINASITIPPGARVVAEITGVRSPVSNTVCASLGLNTRSSYCCGDYSVHLRHGNSPSSTIVYRSSSCQLCPSWFGSLALVELAQSNSYISNLVFSPTAVDGVDTKVVNAYYRFDVTRSLPNSSSAPVLFTFQTPGFKLATTPAPNQLVDVRFVNHDTMTSKIATATALTVSGILSFKGTVPFPLEAGTRYTVFFPELISTNSLPSAQQCLCNAVSPGSTRDAYCCSQFSFSLQIGDSIITQYSAICPVNYGFDDFDPETECILPEENSSSSGEEVNFRCCGPKFYPNLTTEYQAACDEFNCSTPGSPTFNAAECCTKNEYRANDYCCLGNYFCPQHCCGAEIAGTDERQPFIGEKCCALSPGATTENDYFFLALLNNGDDLERWCPCWNYMQLDDVTQTTVQECCLAPNDDHSPPEARLADPSSTSSFPRPSSISRFARQYHRTCDCHQLSDALADALADVTDTRPYTDIFDAIVAEMKLTNPTFNPSVCCVLAQRYADQDTTPSVPPDSALNEFLNSPFCLCYAQGLIGYYETVPYTPPGQPAVAVDCCEFDLFSPYCPIQCASTAGGCCGTDGEGCPVAGGCKCCKRNTNTIRDITTGDSQNIEINILRTKLASDTRYYTHDDL